MQIPDEYMHSQGEELSGLQLQSGGKSPASQNVEDWLFTEWNSHRTRSQMHKCMNEG